MPFNTEETVNFDLGKPPLVEAWIHAVFNSPAEADAWDWNVGKKILDSYSSTLNILEEMFEQTAKMRIINAKEKLGEMQITHRLKYMRARDDAHRRIIQLGFNELMVSRSKRNEEEWLGYSELKRDFLQAWETFCESFHPEGHAQLSLHYVDIVRIPVEGRSEINLQDLFTGAIEFPAEKFGHTIGAAWTAAFVDVKNPAIVTELNVKMELPTPEVFTFRLDWHASASSPVAIDRDSVVQTLDLAHNVLKRQFHAMCAPIWKYFDPS